MSDDEKALAKHFGVDALETDLARLQTERDLTVAALIKIRDYVKAPCLPTMRSIANDALEKMGICDA